MKKFISFALMALFTTSVWGADIFCTDVLASISGTTITQDKGAYTAGTATSWSGELENYFATSGSTGYYQIAFTTPLSLSNYNNVKIKVYWGATANRPLNLSINGANATQIDAVTSSGDRSKVREAESSITVSSISSLKFVSSGGGGVYLFRIEITGTSATTYTVTIDPNGGSYASTPTGWTLTDGKYTKSGLNESFNVPDGLTKTNYDLNGWKDTLGNSITLPFTLSKDTTLVAQWVEHATSSDATLSALSVAGCTLNETFDPDEEDYTIDLPFYASMPVAGDVTATKNDPYAEDPEISVAGNVITIACEAESGATKTYTITVTIASAPAVSSSINIEQNVLTNGLSWDYATALSTANIQYTQPDALDSLNDGKPNRNYAFLGLKMAKKVNATLSVYIAKGSTLRVRFGNVQNMTTFKVAVNGIESTLTTAFANNTTSDANVYEHTATANAGEQIVFTSYTDKALVYKQIMINEAIAAVVLPSTPTSLDNTADETNAIKRIENGMLVIEKNGVRYNAQGQVIR